MNENYATRSRTQPRTRSRTPPRTRSRTPPRPPPPTLENKIDYYKKFILRNKEYLESDSIPDNKVEYDFTKLNEYISLEPAQQIKDFYTMIQKVLKDNTTFISKSLFLQRYNENLNEIKELSKSLDVVSGYNISAISKTKTTKIIFLMAKKIECYGTDDCEQKSNFYWTLYFLKQCLEAGIVIDEMYDFELITDIESILVKESDKPSCFVLCDDFIYSGVQMSTLLKDIDQLDLHKNDVFYFNIVGSSIDGMNRIISGFGEKYYHMKVPKNLIIVDSLKEIMDKNKNTPEIMQKDIKVIYTKLGYKYPVSESELSKILSYVNRTLVILFYKYPDKMSTLPLLCKIIPFYEKYSNYISGGSLTVDINGEIQYLNMNFMYNSENRKKFSNINIISINDKLDAYYIDNIFNIPTTCEGIIRPFYKDIKWLNVPVPAVEGGKRKHRLRTKTKCRRRPKKSRRSRTGHRA
jgi:hypothetical protein